jgi:hypothetical protein
MKIEGRQSEIKKKKSIRHRTWQSEVVYLPIGGYITSSSENWMVWNGPIGAISISPPTDCYMVGRYAGKHTDTGVPCSSPAG